LRIPRGAESKTPEIEITADNTVVARSHWDDFDLRPLAAELRGTRSPPDAEKTIWAFEEALRVARVDDGLLEYLLVAVVCLLATGQGSTPRTVLETVFRRAVSDDSWRSGYAELFG
jgi:hypothetical protein